MANYVNKEAHPSANNAALVFFRPDILINGRAGAILRQLRQGLDARPIWVAKRLGTCEVFDRLYAEKLKVFGDSLSIHHAIWDGFHFGVVLLGSSAHPKPLYERLHLIKGDTVSWRQQPGSLRFVGGRGSSFHAAVHIPVNWTEARKVVDAIFGDQLRKRLVPSQLEVSPPLSHEVAETLLSPLCSDTVFTMLSGLLVRLWAASKLAGVTGAWVDELKLQGSRLTAGLPGLAYREQRDEFIRGSLQIASVMDSEPLKEQLVDNLALARDMRSVVRQILGLPGARQPVEVLLSVLEENSCGLTRWEATYLMAALAVDTNPMAEWCATRLYPLE